MKCLAIVVLLVVFLCPVVHADLINGDFETGDLTGWTLTRPAENWHVTAAAIEDSFTLPYEGNYFAQLSSHTALFYNYDPTILSQEVTISKYDRISGQSVFYSDEPYSGYQGLPFPSAYAAIVRINGETVWQMDERQLNEYYYTHDQTYPSWQSWEWLAPSDGTYTLELIFQPSEQSFYAGAFDNIQVNVPEPPMITTMILGFLVMFGFLKISAAQNSCRHPL